MMPARGHCTSFEARFANRFRLETTNGNWRCMRTPLTVNCMTVEVARGVASLDGDGGGTTTLICDEETYNTWAGLPSNVTATTGTLGPPVPSCGGGGAGGGAAGPRLVPNSEIN